MPDWTFLTNHAHVLLCVVRDPEARLRDVAESVGITERAAQRIMTDLVEAGYLERTRQGRRNSYHLHPDLPLRHPMERETVIGQLMAVLASPTTGHAPRPSSQHEDMTTTAQ
ncbi:winged helix-turn-helix domain-containing protein [Streptomyces sp. NPDC051207]|uniref:helix-turn-helix transcriptional regulator n=1 Tax=Streptomyces sp. NPDC051207 TaxID=3154641 RepID=UPI0034209296